MFDVIVIGARCAGASTALLLGRSGHRVLLLDRATFPSDVISTHFLWPHGASYLNRWGLLDRVKAETPSFTQLKLVNEGIALTGSVPLELLKQHFQTLHGDDSGLVQSYLSVRRRVLDDILVDAAGRAQVDVRQGCAVERLMMEGERVVGVVCRGKDGTLFEERARVVVGADGRNSFVARTLNLPKFDRRKRCTFAYWSYFSGFRLPEAQIHRRGRLAVALVPTNFDQNMVLTWGPGEGTTQALVQRSSTW
jgi:2-polyprenyl-6-methoxyphenol hydroxylase-like FAD-dependent oxidoreductase